MQSLTRWINDSRAASIESWSGRMADNSNYKLHNVLRLEMRCDIGSGPFSTSTSGSKPLIVQCQVNSTNLKLDIAAQVLRVSQLCAVSISIPHNTPHGSARVAKCVIESWIERAFCLGANRTTSTTRLSGSSHVALALSRVPESGPDLDLSFESCY